jgi:hypothetical protein
MGALEPEPRVPKPAEAMPAQTFVVCAQRVENGIKPSRFGVLIQVRSAVVRAQDQAGFSGPRTIQAHGDEILRLS